MLGVGLSNILPQQRLSVWFCVTLVPLAQKLFVSRCSSQSKKKIQPSTQATASLPEEQHDGKHFAGQRPERHAQLDGLLQMVLGDVEAVVADPAAEKDVLAHRALLQCRCDHMSLELIIQEADAHTSIVFCN